MTARKPKRWYGPQRKSSRNTNNIGPGLELVGPMANFSIFSAPAKLVLIFDMLAGRLEIFPLLLLFVRDTWKRF